eukprot:jgi/Mesvir1/24410/Mv11075-RA.1
MPCTTSHGIPGLTSRSSVVSYIHRCELAEDGDMGLYLTEHELRYREYLKLGGTLPETEFVQNLLDGLPAKYRPLVAAVFVKVGVPKPKMANPKQDKTHLEPQAPAKLSRVATVRKDAQPKIGLFIAVRFLLEDPQKDQDEWIWEFVCSINKKRKIPHSILFVEHDGASKTYELALNDLPQDENSKEICAWVALDGVYPEDMTAYRVLECKRSQAAVKAAASVDPNNMQDPVKKRQAAKGSGTI